MINSLDEAIAHCEEVAEKQEIKAKSNLIEIDKIKADGILRLYDADEYESCMKCAEEHRQLAEWLRELKAYKKAYTEIDSKIECDYMGNNEYEMAVSDGYQGAIDIIDRCIEEVNADERV